MTIASNNRRRGTAAEKRAAQLLEGATFAGKAGDVLAVGHVVEVKSSLGLRGYGRLKAHIEQAERNAVAQKKPWLLVITGGRGVGNNEYYVVAPLARWKALVLPDALTRLTRLLRDLQETVNDLYRAKHE